MIGNYLIRPNFLQSQTLSCILCSYLGLVVPLFQKSSSQLSSFILLSVFPSKFRPRRLLKRALAHVFKLQEGARAVFIGSPDCVWLVQSLGRGGKLDVDWVNDNGGRTSDWLGFLGWTLPIKTRVCSNCLPIPFSIFLSSQICTYKDRITDRWEYHLFDTNLIYDSPIVFICYGWVNIFFQITGKPQKMDTLQQTQLRHVRGYHIIFNGNWSSTGTVVTSFF